MKTRLRLQLAIEDDAGTVELAKLYELGWLELAYPGPYPVLAQDVQDLYRKLKAASAVRKEQDK